MWLGTWAHLTHSANLVDAYSATFLFPNLVRWPSTTAVLEKLITLRNPISEYLFLHPDMAHLGLSPEEWLILTEVCGVLELFKYVDTAMDGGGSGDGCIGRSVFLCNTLLELLRDGTTNIINHCGVSGACAVHKPIADLHSTTTKFIGVAVDELKQRNIHVPGLEVELLAMFLDPRYKSLDGDACGGEDHAERLAVALVKLRGGLRDSHTALPPPPPAAAGRAVEPPSSTTTTTPAKRLAEEVEEDPFAEYSRKRKKRAAAAAAAAAAFRTVGSRFDKEVAQYKALPEMTASKFHLHSFWDEAAKPRLDANGNVVEVARFPMLAMLARVFHSAETTSFRSDGGTSCFQSENGATSSQPGRYPTSYRCERDLSEVVRGMGSLRKSMRRDSIEMMMFLKLNQRFIPEVRSHAQNMDDMQKGRPDGF